MYKKVIVVLLLACSVAFGVIQYELEYGVEVTIDFPLIDSNSPWRLYKTAPATADVNVFRNQKAAASSTNAVADEGPFMSLTLTAAEMAAKTITITIMDATAPPVFMEEVLLITTRGDANSLNDLTTAVFADANWTDLVAYVELYLDVIISDANTTVDDYLELYLDYKISDVNDVLGTAIAAAGTPDYNDLMGMTFGAQTPGTYGWEIYTIKKNTSSR